MSSLDFSLTGEGNPKIRRLNKLPIYLFFGIIVLFTGTIIWGLSVRGFNRGDTISQTSTGAPATDFADQLKRGVSDGVIEAPAQAPAHSPAVEVENTQPSASPFKKQPQTQLAHLAPTPESAVDWRDRLQRDQEEQMLRLMHQQRMARIQAEDAAYDSPIAVDIGNAGEGALLRSPHYAPGQGTHGDRAVVSDLYAAAMRAGSTGQQTDLNNQSGKSEFLNQSQSDPGYLPHRVTPAQSPYELKRGSVIPATLVTGINSDLPGRITAQVSQNVYDSATGYRLLIPQGAKLFGRYDSNVSYGQRRVLVIWTDLIFPNGSTLQLAGMAGVDGQGYGGFRDQVDNRYLQTFGAAVLIAVIGTGIDMAAPDRSAQGRQDTASDAARRNFAESFGRVAEKTVSRNLDVQPTLKIRPGYTFNIIVEQDVIFPTAYR